MPPSVAIAPGVVAEREVVSQAFTLGLAQSRRRSANSTNLLSGGHGAEVASRTDTSYDASEDGTRRQQQNARGGGAVLFVAYCGLCLVGVGLVIAILGLGPEVSLRSA